MVIAIFSIASIIFCNNTAIQEDQPEIACQNLGARKTCVAINVDGTRIASGDERGNLSIFNNVGLKIIDIKAHDGQIYDVSFSHNGRLVASTGAGMWVGGNLGDIYTSNLKIAKSSPKSKQRDPYITSGNANSRAPVGAVVKIWNVGNAQLLYTYRNEHDLVDDIKFINDDKNIIMASNRNFDMSIMEYDSGRLIAAIKPPHLTRQVVGGPIRTCSFDATGHRAISNANSMNETRGTFKLWDMEKNLFTILPIGDTLTPISTVTISPDGKHIAASGVNNTLYQWDFDNPNSKSTFSAKITNVSDTRFLEYLSDNVRIILGDNYGTVVLWNTKTGKIDEVFENPVKLKTKTIEGISNHVRAISQLRDRIRVVSGGYYTVGAESREKSTSTEQMYIWDIILHEQ